MSTSEKGSSMGWCAPDSSTSICDHTLGSNSSASSFISKGLSSNPDLQHQLPPRSLSPVQSLRLCPALQTENPHLSKIRVMPVACRCVMRCWRHWPRVMDVNQAKRRGRRGDLPAFQVAGTPGGHCKVDSAAQAEDRKDS